MKRGNQDLIAALAQDLQPTRALRFGDGLALAGAAMAATMVGVVLLLGVYDAGVKGHASPYFYLTNGLLAVLGLASTTSVIAMAAPRVGNRHGAPRWAMAMVAILPIVAVLTLLDTAGAAGLAHDHGWLCTQRGLIAGLLTGGVLLWWLRRGAPVSPKTAGLHLGVAAGSLGSVAYGIHCPVDTLDHLGLAHVAPVLISALAGRFALPPLLRW